MPIIRKWFDSPQTLDWETEDRSFHDQRNGPRFYTYPAYWLLPFVEPTEDEVLAAPAPLWVTELPPTHPFGKVDSVGEGTYIIDLPQSFEVYLESLDYKHRKRFRAALRDNVDLEVRDGSSADVLKLWDGYAARIQELQAGMGDPPYTQDELELRKTFYTSSSLTRISFFLDGELIAVNLSMYAGGICYDLAALLSPNPDLKKRSLGNFATLKSIEQAITRGTATYDLLTGNCGYKHTFGAKEVKMKHYLKCSKEFAAAYGIPAEEISAEVV